MRVGTLAGGECVSGPGGALAEPGILIAGRLTAA